MKTSHKSDELKKKKEKKEGVHKSGTYVYYKLAAIYTNCSDHLNWNIQHIIRMMTWGMRGYG